MDSFAANFLPPASVELSDVPPQIFLDVAVAPEREAEDSIAQQARAIHTAVYLEKNYIDNTDLNEEGLFVNEYSARSRYFVEENEARIAACSLIEANKKEGVMSLPTARYFSLDSEALKQAAGVKRLVDIKPSEVVEVSGLGSVPKAEGKPRTGDLGATKLLYASLVRDSLEHGNKLWLLNTDPLLVRSLEALVGKEQVYTLGEAREYMGPPTIPIAINPQQVVRSAFADNSEHGQMKQAYLRKALTGMDSKRLPKDITELLDNNDIAYEKQSHFKRLITDRRALAYAAILGYSSARALPVTGIQEFDGSVPLLWGIDVATALPYTWGLLETVGGKSRGRRTVGAAVAAGCFVSPYAYFWAEGEGYPPYVNAIVAGLIGTASLLEVRKMRQERKIQQYLREPKDSNKKQ